MAASRDKPDDRTRGVQFTADSARVIADTVRIVQGGNRGQPSITSGRSVYATPHYLSKTTADWLKDTKASLEIWTGDGGGEAEATSETVEAWNKWGLVRSGEWVLIGRANGTFYLTQGPPQVMRGTFLPPWNKGATATVTGATFSGTVTAMNYFATVKGTDSKKCAIAAVGNEWILIAAEC